MLPSWLGGDSSSEDEYDDYDLPVDHHQERPEGSSRLRAIGSTVKHEAKERLSQLAKSERASKVVDGLTDLIGDATRGKARDEVDKLKARSKDLWSNAMRGDEAKIEKTKRVTTKALEITEKLAMSADPEGEVAHTFADAARKLKDIVATGKNREEVLAMSKTLGLDVWGKLKSKAETNENFSGMRGTVERIVDQVKGLMEKLKEEKLKRDEAAAISAVLDTGESATTEQIDLRLKTLADDSKGVWNDIRADEQVRKLIKEEVVPGFERLIRGAVQVSCELMSQLELPRVDGVYDSPIGSVCYHVDNVHFTEFKIDKESLRVINHMDEDELGAGLSTTVQVENINTIMQDVEFAYCEFPRNWGVVDGEGLCTVTVEGASVGITYEIIVNTQQLMKLVNQGVELAKDDGKIEEMKEKIAVKMKERKERKEREAAAAAAAGTPPKPIAKPEPPKDDGPERESFGSPKDDVDALGSALDRAFGASMFNDSEEQFESPPLSPTSPDAFHDATDDARVLNAKEKLVRNRRVVGEILGEGFLGDEPVLELRVHTTHISVGELDVQISGTSAAWLYNMIALVLTQQLRGRIEEKINNITVKQLARVSDAVAAYSAGLIEVCVYQDESDDDDDIGSLLSGVTGSLRQNPGTWGEDWRCSHCPGEAPEHVEARRKFGSRSQSKTSFEGLDELIQEHEKEQAARDKNDRNSLDDVDWHDIASPM